MGKIALLVSREEMLYQAHNLLQEKAYDIGVMRVITTGEAVSEARRSVAQGAAIIIARGLQASLIKQYTDIPVAEIMITAQEMALLVVRAKQILKKKNPVIGVIGFENMFCNMSYFDMIYEIDLRTYFAGKGSELEAAAEQAVADGVDLMIGGDTAVEVAGRHGIPSLFLSITEDSMRNAFEMAERMAFAMGAEKRNAAQMETLANQYRLYQLIRHRLRYGRGVIRYPNADVRIIVTSHKPLLHFVRDGRFREDLYYLLTGLLVQIPPLRERKEDLRIKIETAIRDCCENYSRYHVLTRGAAERLLLYPWRGNLLQVESFCERLILTANKRSLDEIAVGRVLEDLYQEEAVAEEAFGAGNGKDYPEEAEEILKILRRMRGNREKTAQALGMSKATLWRRMKEYGLEW